MHASMKRPLLVVSACALAIYSFPAAASDGMEPGQWEMTMSTGDAAHTVSRCVTADEVASVNGTPDEARRHAEASAIKGHCALKAFDKKADAVSYTLACGTRTIESTATYETGAYNGVLTTTDGSGSAPVKTYVKAHRTGACS